MNADSQIQRGQQWLKTLLQLSGISTEIEGELEENAVAGDNSSAKHGYWLTIDQGKLTPEQIQILLGKDGSVLDAIQYLANSVLNLSQTPEQQCSYTIELDGYRINRQAEIWQIAQRAAEQVRNMGTEVEIKSLSSAERRQVHSFFQEYPDLETFSRGREPHRHLVVRPASIE
ncbi:MAG: R3H domain-containing nucleic acid-binding protein [Nostocaceae cyanobacterium]|nr:R3H domain-containing nucleic acid-binding protein [Nostocaceae cyanobacterium]